MASFLPALASFFNPANIIRGLGTSVTGVLDNISKGQSVDISGNLSKGIKTALSSDDNQHDADKPAPPNYGRSVIGSTGGNYAYEPQRSSYPDNQAANVNIQRVARLNTLIPPKNNATSYRPAYTDNYGRAGVYKDRALSPVSFNTEVETVSSAPAGLPSFEKNIRMYNRDRIPSKDITIRNPEQQDIALRNPQQQDIALRDAYGYKGQSYHKELQPQFEAMSVSKRPKKKREGKPFQPKKNEKNRMIEKELVIPPLKIKRDNKNRK